jgi:hypothetical protein
LAVELKTIVEVGSTHWLDELVVVEAVVVVLSAAQLNDGVVHAPLA